MRWVGLVYLAICVRQSTHYVIIEVQIVMFFLICNSSTKQLSRSKVVLCVLCWQSIESSLHIDTNVPSCCISIQVHHRHRHHRYACSKRQHRLASQHRPHRYRAISVQFRRSICRSFCADCMLVGELFIRFVVELTLFFFGGFLGLHWNNFVSWMLSFGIVCLLSISFFLSLDQFLTTIDKHRR